MAMSFKEALESALEKTGIKLPEVAARSGVSYEQLKKLRQRPAASTNVDDARLIANAFGMSLDEFMGDQTIQDRIAVVETYNALTQEERELLRRLSASGS